MLNSRIEQLITQQRLLTLADRRRALWRVGLEVLTGRTVHAIRWEGYATTSTDASGQALSWAENRVAEVSDECRVRVVEVLQVGT